MNAKTIVDKLLEADIDDPESMLPHVKMVVGCPHCGCPEYEIGLGFVTPHGETVQNVYCKKCGRSYCRGEEKAKLV